jgi:hypothetical protein
MSEAMTCRGGPLRIRLVAKAALSARRAGTKGNFQSSRCAVVFWNRFRYDATTAGAVHVNGGHQGGGPDAEWTVTEKEHMRY